MSLAENQENLQKQKQWSLAELQKKTASNGFIIDNEEVEQVNNLCIIGRVEIKRGAFSRMTSALTTRQIHVCIETTVYFSFSHQLMDVLLMILQEALSILVVC